MVIVLVSRYHPTKKLPQSRPWASPATLTTSSYLVGWFQVILVGYVSYWRRAHYCCHTSTNLCRVGYQWKWRNTDAKNHFFPYVLNTYMICIWLYIQRTFTVCCCLEEAESSCAAWRHVVVQWSIANVSHKWYWFNKCQTNVQWLPMRPQYVLKCVHCLIFTKIILSSMSLDTCTYKTEKQNGSNNGILTSRLLLSDLHWEKTWKNNDSLSSRLWSTPVSHLKSDPRGTYHLILKSCAHIIHFRNLGTSVFRHKLDCALAMELWNWSCTTLWCET